MFLIIARKRCVLRILKSHPFTPPPPPDSICGTDVLITRGVSRDKAAASRDTSRRRVNAFLSRCFPHFRQNAVVLRRNEYDRPNCSIIGAAQQWPRAIIVRSLIFEPAFARGLRARAINGRCTPPRPSPPPRATLYLIHRVLILILISMHTITGWVSRNLHAITMHRDRRETFDSYENNEATSSRR